MNTNLKAFDAGIAEERRRIREIMNLDETRGREGAALSLALGGELGIDAIRHVLVLSVRGPVPTFITRIRIPSHLKLASLKPGVQ